MNSLNDDVAVEVLHRAVEIIGSTAALADHLRISHRKLQDYLARREPIPCEIFLILVEMVVPALLTELFARHKSLKS